MALRPYQLQTLQFMKDVEAAPGGYRSLFWLHCTGPRGEAYYYSPALGRVALTVPDMDTGGFLGEWWGSDRPPIARLCRRNNMKIKLYSHAAVSGTENKGRGTY